MSPNESAPADTRALPTVAAEQPAPSVGVYADAFPNYRAAKWLSVLPLPPRAKTPPPAGYTGRDAVEPSYPDCHAWAEDNPNGNVALRLPPGVIGIDVDHYGDKDGGGTLATYEAKYGPLPHTWRTGSRTDGTSGIRLYRVPVGLRWPGVLGPGIEIIQDRHRYAIVWPSIHPETGGTYHWSRHGAKGTQHGAPVPSVADLEELPAAWVDGLTNGMEAQSIVAADLADGEAAQWIQTRGAGSPCHAVDRAIASGTRAIRSAESRHDSANTSVMSVARLAAEGHTGAGVALQRVRAEFQAAADNRSPEALAAEWGRMVIGAVRIAAATEQGAYDPCTWPFEGIVERTPAAVAQVAEALAMPLPPVPSAIVSGDVQHVAEDVVERVLPILDWADRWDRPLTEEWIVPPILPARRLVSLYSPPKMGKSLLMLELAAAVACGREVLGVTPDRPRKVLYVDFENDPDADVIPRLKAMGYQAGDLAGLKYLSFPTMGTLDSERGSLELVAAIDYYRCEVVVVDTVSRSVQGPENENDTWLNFYRHTGLKLKQRGVSLVRLDHTGKDETKGQRGGSAKSGDVDAVWRLSADPGGTFTLTCEIARMPVNEKELILSRVSDPHLRHKVEGGGWKARKDSLRDKARDVLEALDTLGVPLATGRDKARELLLEAGYPSVRTELIAEAVRIRKARPEQGVLDGIMAPEKLFPDRGNR